MIHKVYPKKDYRITQKEADRAKIFRDEMIYYSELVFEYVNIKSIRNCLNEQLIAETLGWGFNVS